MIITEIIEHKGKCRISLNDDPAFWLYKRELTECGLHEGDELSEEAVQSIYREIIGKRAKKYTLKLLEARDYTTQGIREKLQKADYPQEVVEDAINYAASFHYIDDFRYACSYIESHAQTKGRQYLKSVLLGKGVSADIIQNALEEVYPEDNSEVIRYWMEKKHYDPQQADEEMRTKFTQFLMRKGFSYHEIRKFI